MKIRELLTDKSKWTKGYDAQDISGERTSPMSEEAVCWCLAGALHRCYLPEQRQEIQDKIGLNISILFASIVGWNDMPDRTFEEVKALVEELDI